jgi:hypothetical protein
MRIRSALAVALLLLPEIVSAQARAPRVRGGGRHPGEPVPLGPQPEVVARSQALIRSRYSVETYPLISRVGAPGFSPGSPTSWWTSYGTGTRLDWRHNNYVSWTLDLTSSFLGGPANTETAELGARVRPESWEGRFRPFADVRFGFEHAQQSYSQPTNLGIGPSSGLASASHYSKGYGAVAGAGIEYALTNTFALTTGLSAMRTNMVAYRFNGLSVPSGENSYRMTTYRFAVGLKYNPVRMVRSSSDKKE